MEATPLALMSGLSAQAHYANGIKIAKCPALLITQTFRRFVQSLPLAKGGREAISCSNNATSFGYMFTLCIDLYLLSLKSHFLVHK